jgi:hypothetical protein
MDNRIVKLRRGALIIKPLPTLDLSCSPDSAMKRTFAVPASNTVDETVSLHMHCRSTLPTASGGSYYVNLGARFHPDDGDSFTVAVSDRLLSAEDAADFPYIPGSILEQAAAEIERNSVQCSGLLCFHSSRLHPVDHKDRHYARAVRGIVRVTLGGIHALSDDQIQEMFEGL